MILKLNSRSIRHPLKGDSAEEENSEDDDLDPEETDLDINVGEHAKGEEEKCVSITRTVCTVGQGEQMFEFIKVKFRFQILNIKMSYFASFLSTDGDADVNDGTEKVQL